MIASEIQKLLANAKGEISILLFGTFIYLNEVTYTDVDCNVYMVVSFPRPIYRTASQCRQVHKTIVHDS